MKNLLFKGMIIVTLMFIVFVEAMIGIHRNIESKKETDELYRNIKVEEVNVDYIRMERHIKWYQMDTLSNGDYVYYGNDGVIHQYDSELVDIMKSEGKTGVDIIDNYKL